MRGAAVFLALVLTAACTAPPENAVPLDPTGGLRPDPALLGVWYSADANEAVVVSIIADDTEDRAALRVMASVLTDQAAAPLHWLTAQAVPTTLDGATYYNVRRLDGARYAPIDESRGIILARTRIDADDRLSLEFMSHAMLSALVDQGRLKGRIVRGEYERTEVAYLALDLTADALAELIRGTGPDTLFTLRFGPLRRLPATPEQAGTSER